jgi:hypothetical protein
MKKELQKEWRGELIENKFYFYSIASILCGMNEKCIVSDNNYKLQNNEGIFLYRIVNYFSFHTPTFYEAFENNCADINIKKY